jgi:hypothetical protein
MYCIVHHCLTLPERPGNLAALLKNLPLPVLTEREGSAALGQCAIRERSMKANVHRNCASLVAAAALSACATGPNFHSPAPPATEHYTPAPQPADTVASPGRGGDAQSFSAEHDLPADWWTLFHSQVLDELIRRALADNPTVQAAKATLQTAMATYKAQRGALLLPAADAQVSATAEYRQAVLSALQDVADT